MSTERVASYSPYKILGLPEDSSLHAVKKKYHRVVCKYHPDVNPHNPNANKIFDLSTRAYKIIVEINRIKLRRPGFNRGGHLFMPVHRVHFTPPGSRTRVYRSQEYVVDIDHGEFINSIRENFNNYLKAVKKIKKKERVSFDLPLSPRGWPPRFT